MADIPQSLHEGRLIIHGVTLVCHTLEDGRRVVTEESANDLFRALFERGDFLTQADMFAISSFVNGEGCT